jgi:hypothetical protein
VFTPNKTCKVIEIGIVTIIAAIRKLYIFKCLKCIFQDNKNNKITEMKETDKSKIARPKILCDLSSCIDIVYLLRY